MSLKTKKTKKKWIRLKRIAYCLLLITIWILKGIVFLLTLLIILAERGLKHLS